MQSKKWRLGSISFECFFDSASFSCCRIRHQPKRQIFGGALKDIAIRFPSRFSWKTTSKIFFEKQQQQQQNKTKTGNGNLWWIFFFIKGKKSIRGFKEHNWRIEKKRCIVAREFERKGKISFFFFFLLFLSKNLLNWCIQMLFFFLPHSQLKEIDLLKKHLHEITVDCNSLAESMSALEKSTEISQLEVRIYFFSYFLLFLFKKKKKD